MDSMRVIVGEETNNSQNQPQSQHSQIRQAGTHKSAVYTGASEGIYRELSGNSGQMSVSGTPEPSLVETDKGTLVYDPMSTLETNGDPIGSDMSKATDASTIKLGGMQMRLSEAMNLGFIAKDAQGNYSMTEDGEHFHITKSESQMAQHQQAKQDMQDATSSTVSEETGHHIQQLSNRAGASFANSVTSCVEAMLNQDNDAYHQAVHELEGAAQARGLDGFMETAIMEANDSLIEGVEAAFGIAPDELEAFASETIPAREMGGLLAAWMQGDLSVIQYIENKYMDKFQAWKARQK